MGLPKQHLPGQSVHSIRRTVEGIFYLSPTPDCLRALPYTYGIGVEQSGVMPHVEVTMSNHRQGTFTCLTGRRYKFHEQHHGVFARQYNGRLGRSGYMWDHRGPTEPILLPDTDKFEDVEFPFAHAEDKEREERWISRWDALGLDTIDRTILYDLMNPVAADLVQHLRSFPGFTIAPWDWGKWSVNSRPEWFNIGYPQLSAFMALPPPRWWDQAELVDCGDCRIVVVPELLDAFEERRSWAKDERPWGSQRFDPAAFELFISTDQLRRARAHYLELMDILEEQFRKERARAGRRVVGPKRLKRQDPLKKPREDVVLGTSGYSPRFTGPENAVKRAHAAYRVFEETYKVARRKFRATRDFDIVFPAGTIKMVQMAGVRCRGRPLPDENPMPR